MNIPSMPLVQKLIDLALQEDLGTGDITTMITVDPEKTGTAVIRCKEPAVICGHPVAESVFRRIDPDLEYQVLLGDGSQAVAGAVISTVTGRIVSILTGERTALNFLQRMSGVATQTQKIISGIENRDVTILDTRKTVPGWRILDKYSVRTGGGTNHRMSLSDGILIKDNHIKAAGGIAIAVNRAVRFRPHSLLIQVEVSSLDEALEAVASGADALLLDNMHPALIKEIAGRLPDRIRLETSGNITPKNVEEYAASGIDYVSMGILTHSARAVDISLKL